MLKILAWCLQDKEQRKQKETKHKINGGHHDRKYKHQNRDKD